MRISAFALGAIGIAMLLVSCMKQATVLPSKETVGIEGIQWHLTEVGGSSVSPMADDKQPHLLLDPALNTNGKAKIFGVSVKDRGAIPMAGHAGKAFWFSKAKGEFVTSTYYYDAYPGWVEEWNRKKLPQAYADTNWELMHEKSTYTYGDYDDIPWETDFPGYGVVFPHPFGKGDGKYFTTLLTCSPAGDELTLEFARELIVKENLGQDEVPDYLSISFSSSEGIPRARTTCRSPKGGTMPCGCIIHARKFWTAPGRSRRLNR